MSYSRHTWECGETITAEKMNNLEGGVEEALECCGSGDGILVVRFDHYDEEASRYYFDKTWQEVYNALHSGTIVVITNYAYYMVFVNQAREDNGLWYVSVTPSVQFYADSANDYIYIGDR